MITILKITLIAIFFKPILNWLAMQLYAILSQLNNLLVAYKYSNKSVVGFVKEWFKYSFNSAMNIDVYAQYDLRTLWNFLFSKSGNNFKFGTNQIETISSVLGFKKFENSLGWFGVIWYYLLYAFDITKWFKGGHCANAIDWELHELINLK